MVQAGRSGNVITKVKKVPVVAAGFMLPKSIVAAVQARVPYRFTTSDHTRLWQHFELHSRGWTAPDGGETVSEFCVPNEPTKQYVYTPAWVEKIVREVGTAEKYAAFFGRTPRKGKVTPIEAAPSTQEQRNQVTLEKVVG